MNDRDLDELFREAAAHHAPAGRKEVVWDNLSRRLDALPTKRKRRRWGFWIFMGLILATLGIWQYRTAGPLSRGNSPASHNHPVTQTKSLSVAPPKKSSGIHSTDQKLPVTPDSHIAPGVSPEAGNMAPEADYSATLSPSPATAVPKDQTLDQTDPSDSRTVNPDNREVYPLADLAAFRLSIAGVTRPVTGYPTLQGVVPPVIVGSIPSIPISGDSIEPAKQKEGRKTSLPFHRWSLGLSLGPDWNSAAARGWRTGIGGGLLLGYQLTRKWGISTGVLVDKKLYAARPGDYHAPDDILSNYDVRSIDARCTMIDVPLNISYSLWQHKDKRIILSAGVSSFWMQEEKYTYNYKTSAGNWDDWTKEMYGKNHHLFSILNIAPSFEQSGKHFFYQVTPYFKVPLEGIGYGKVKLISTGIHFTIGYGLK